MTRQALDARNSDSRPPTAFEMISNRWNDPSFNPIAQASTVHQEFMAATNCSHSLVGSITPATPQKVKDALASLRVNLTRIIGNWEQSGQGEGGHHGSPSTNEERFGSLVGRPAYALSTRADFLNGRPPYTLYFWELADEHQILQNSIQRLDEDSGASDASSAPSTVSSRRDTPVHGRRKGRQESERQESGDIQALSDSIRVLAESETRRAQLHVESEDRRTLAENHRARLRDNGENSRHVRQRIGDLQDQAREYRKMYAETDDANSRRAQFYHAEEQRITSEIAALSESLVATPTRGNITPTPRRSATRFGELEF